MGADIPGFFGEPDDDLYIMFYQLGTFYPFMRAHGHLDMLNREPFLQSQPVQKVIKASLKLRYDLIHYMYTYQYLASTEGLPILRPIWMEFPSMIRDAETSFMFGDAFLVVPKLSVIKGENSPMDSLYPIAVDLPNETGWYDYWSHS